MSGTIGVERIFPVNLPAFKKLKLTKEVKYVELVFSTLEVLLVKKLELLKKEENNLFLHRFKKALRNLKAFCYYTNVNNYG